MQVEKPTFSLPSWLEAQWRSRSLCTVTLRIMPAEFTITSLVEWQAVTLSRWWVGALRTARSIGKLQIPGTHIGARKVISAFAVATTRAELKTKLLDLLQMPSGAVLETHRLLCERALTFETF